MFEYLQEHNFTLYLASGFFVFSFLWICSVVYLKIKWMAKVEELLGEPAFHSSNFFLAGHGTLHYGVVFMWDYQAKRFNLYEERDAVPKYIQRQFMMSVWFCVLGLLHLCLFHVVA